MSVEPHLVELADQVHDAEEYELYTYRKLLAYELTTPPANAEHVAEVRRAAHGAHEDTFAALRAYFEANERILGRTP